MKANLEFESLVATLPPLFAKLHNSKSFTKKGTTDQKGKKGVYAFYDGDSALHVGRTRNLMRRLRGHTLKRHNTATFAFKLTRQILDRQATYRPLGSRLNLMSDPDFKSEFERQLERVKHMGVRFVEVEPPLQQYLLELYAHMEYGLGLDEFDTH